MSVRDHKFHGTFELYLLPGLLSYIVGIICTERHGPVHRGSPANPLLSHNALYYELQPRPDPKEAKHRQEIE